jgi:hypothetical protein
VEDVVGKIPLRMSIYQDDTVRDWILASDVVVSSYSTSLIEASLALRPAYIVEPTTLPDALHQGWHDLAPRITTERAFESAATGETKPTGTTPLARWARDTMMSRGDAILLIADQLARIRRREVPVPSRASWQSLTVPSLRPVPRRVAFEFRRHVRTRFQTLPREIPGETRQDVAAVQEIPDRVRRWGTVLDDYLSANDRVA